MFRRSSARFLSGSESFTLSHTRVDQLFTFHNRRIIALLQPTWKSRRISGCRHKYISISFACHYTSLKGSRNLLPIVWSIIGSSALGYCCLLWQTRTLFKKALFITLFKKADSPFSLVVPQDFWDISGISWKLKRSRDNHAVRGRQKTFKSRRLGHNSILLRCLHSCGPLGMCNQQFLVFISVTVFIGSSTSYHTPRTEALCFSRGSRGYFTPEV